LTGWVLVGFIITVAALIIGVPPMLGWSNDRLAFAAGLAMFVAAFAWLFIPLPKPDSNVDCGTIVKPRSDWTGESFNWGPGPLGDVTPDFHRQCAANRSEGIQQAVLLALAGGGVMVFYGARERKRLVGTSSRD
jgi:hypothetical protein